MKMKDKLLPLNGIFKRRHYFAPRGVLKNAFGNAQSAMLRTQCV